MPCPHYVGEMAEMDINNMPIVTSSESLKELYAVALIGRGVKATLRQ